MGQAAHHAFCRNPHRRSLGPLGCLLVRAFPQKSSGRNFARWCASASSWSSPSVAQFVASSLQAMLVGESGDGVETVASATLAVRVASAMSDVDGPVLAQWASSCHRWPVIYLAARWSVVSMMRDVPGLRLAVCARMTSWPDYEAWVVAQVNEARRAANKASASADERVLDGVAGAACGAQCTRGMRVTLGGASSGDGDALAAMCRRASVVHSLVRTGEVPTVPRDMRALWLLLESSWRASAAEMLCLVERTGMSPVSLRWWWASSLSVDRGQARAWYQSLDAPQRSLSLEFAHTIMVRACVRTHPLCARATATQLASRASRAARGLVITRSYVFGCVTCRQIRGFVCLPRAAATGDAAAQGTARAIVDFDTGLLYCGRRVERTSLNHAACRKTRLLKMYMDGRVLEWFGRYLLLCPTCTRLCEYPCMAPPVGDGPVYRDGLYTCTSCRHGGDDPMLNSESSAASWVCAHCGGSASSSSAITWRGARWCVRCRRDWMTASTGQGTAADDVLVHRAIDERWGRRRLLAAIRNANSAPAVHPSGDAIVATGE